MSDELELCFQKYVYMLLSICVGMWINHALEQWNSELIMWINQAYEYESPN